MIAQFINYTGILGAETIGLCLVQPNRVQQPKKTLSFPSDVSRLAPSKKESRRTFANSARYQTTYLATLRTAADLTEFRLFLNQLKTQTVAVPLWDDGCQLTAAANIAALTLATDQHPACSGAEWIIVSPDFLTYEIVTTDTIGANTVHVPAGIANNWPIGSLLYPLLFGRLVDRPELDDITPSRGTFPLTFKEDSPYARRLNQWNATIATVGAQVTQTGLSALPLWTLEPRWERVLDRTEIDTIFEEIGFTRQEATRDFGYPVARGIEAEFWCKGRDQIAFLEKIFADRRGAVSTFMYPTWRRDLELTADLPISGHVRQINIAASEYSDATRTAHPGDPYIAIIESVSGQALAGVDPHQIATVAGGVLTTVADIVQAHSKGAARISQLMLVRLLDSQMELTYITPLRATCRLKFIEMPHEYVNPAPTLERDVFLFQFVESSRFPQTFRFTSYEDVFVDSDANSWTPASFAWSNANRSLDPGNCTFEIHSADFSGNPLKKFFPKRLEGPLQCAVYRANAANPSQPKRYMFSGTVSEVSMKFDKASVKRYSREPDLKVPKQLFSQLDNWTTLDPALQIDESTIKVSGVIYAIAGTQVDVTSSTAFGKAADYFANGGRVELGTNYSTVETRSVLHSEPLAPDKVRLILDDGLYKNDVGANIDIYPGYDGTIDQLDTKYGARANHGGHPYVPAFDPGVRAVQSKDASGGKGK